ncbi:MAG: hypothetical protein QNJ51_04625 [Calothrix sp. MO_167.B12]|nr:hypothetical protein [Calothrix sp. MO_167.B12]
MRSLALFLGASITTFICFTHQVSLAENQPQLIASEAPLELELLKQNTGFVVTANTIYQDKMAVPSFWWAKENSENKLLDNWIAYPASVKEPARVDLVVNQQIWSLLDYLERYNFVNQMGNLARTYSYNVRVFNYQQERLATYTCNFENSPALCNIEMNTQNSMGLESSL